MDALHQLIDVVKRLRAPDGCPWDREQTFQSLTPHIIEEAYELVDAIQDNDTDGIKEELGDALLHVVMLSCMAEEGQLFNLEAVAQHVSDKMISRHPHVFGDVKVDSIDEVWKNWESIKKTEKSGSVMDTIPKTLPALMQAHKIQKRAARLGFDWDSIEGPLDKLSEEVDEFKDAVNNHPHNKEDIEEEAGDILFTIVNILRQLDIEPEEALRKSNQKFISRFKSVETECTATNQDMTKMTLEELDRLWDKAKQS